MRGAQSGADFDDDPRAQGKVAYSVFPSVILNAVKRRSCAVLSAAKELVAPRPFSSFEDSGLRAAAGGRLRGAISDVARQGERSIASRRSFPFGFAQGFGSPADSAQDDSNKRQDSASQLEPLLVRVTPIYEI